MLMSSAVDCSRSKHRILGLGTPRYPAPLEKRNKRLTVALTLMTVAVYAAVTMAMTGAKVGKFDIVEARTIWVKNDAGQIVVMLDANDGGNGLVSTYSVKGKDLVDLTSTVDDRSAVTTYQPNGKELVALGATVNGRGLVTTYQPNRKRLVTLSASDSGGAVLIYQPNGKQLVVLNSSDNGGLIEVINKPGEPIATMVPMNTTTVRSALGTATAGAAR